MRFLSRLVMVLALLGGLAYGSYALGRYVLSTRLFGTTMKPSEDTALDAVARSTRVAGAVTRQVDIKGKPRVEVKVLPADQAGPGPEPPSITDLEKAAQGKSYTPSRPSRTRIVTPQTFRAVPRVRDNSGSRYTSGDEAEERPRRRRRRRRTRRSDTNSNTSRTTRSDYSSPSSGDDGGVTILGGESSTPEYSSGSSSEAPMPREDGTPSRSYRSNSSSEERPRARRRVRRERSSSDESSSTRSSRSRRTINESPVPRPEGGSSGESPIPQPE